MKYDPAKHKRRSIRLKGYDYSQAGLYFITICIQDREMLLGKIKNDEMLLNDAGKMVRKEWEKLPQRFNAIVLHEFVIMPNHFHAILEIVRATLVVAPNEAARDETGELPGATTRVAPTTPDAMGQLPGATTRVAPTVAPNETAPDEAGELPGATTRVAQIAKTIGDVMGAFKSITTGKYIDGVKNYGWPSFNRKLWQRNYYEHIIRNERAYENISEYIINNPARWQDDKFHKT